MDSDLAHTYRDKLINQKSKNNKPQARYESNTLNDGLKTYHKTELSVFFDTKRPDLGKSHSYIPHPIQTFHVLRVIV